MYFFEVYGCVCFGGDGFFCDCGFGDDVNVGEGGGEGRYDDVECVGVMMMCVRSVWGE